MYSFFSRRLRIFSRIDYIRTIEGLNVKIFISYKLHSLTTKQYTEKLKQKEIWKLTYVNQQFVKNKKQIKKEIIKYLQENKNETNHTKSSLCYENSTQNEI